MSSELSIANLKYLIRHSQREYRELSSNWSSIERKAQLTLGGSATILAVGGGFILGNPDVTNSASILATFFTALLLGVVAYYCLEALTVGSTTLPPPPEKLRAFARRKKRANPEISEVELERELLRREVIMWETACQDLNAAVVAKGVLVREAHGWVKVAVLPLLVALLFAAFRR